MNWRNKLWLRWRRTWRDLSDDWKIIPKTNRLVEWGHLRPDSTSRLLYSLLFCLASVGGLTGGALAEVTPEPKKTTATERAAKTGIKTSAESGDVKTGVHQAGSDETTVLDPLIEPDNGDEEGVLPGSESNGANRPGVADSVSLRRTATPPTWWDADWQIRLLGAGGSEQLLSREQLSTSAALTLSEVLADETHLGSFKSGSHGTWDVPYLISPAVERLSLWYQGQGTTGAAFPEAITHSLSLLPVSEFHYIPPDPFIDPLASGGEGMIYGLNDLPNWEETPSAIRLAEGPNGASVEDAILARQVDPWRVLTCIGHLSSEGRIFYGGSKYQHLMMQLERSTRLGAFRLTGGDRSGRYKMIGGQKQTWTSQMLALGWQYATLGDGEGEFHLVRRNEQLNWYEQGTAGHRRAISTEVTIFSAFPVGPLSLLTSQALSWTSLSYRVDQDTKKINSRSGNGIAIGALWEDEQSRLLVSVGRTDPWWDEAIYRGRFVLGRRLVGGQIDLSGWYGGAQVFQPGLEPRGISLISDGISLPDDMFLINNEQRRVGHLEISGAVKRTGSSFRSSLFLRRVRDGLGLEEVAGNPAHQSNITLKGARCSLRMRLPFGSFISGNLTAIFDPVVDDLPDLIAPYRGSITFSLRRLLCREELDLEFRLICEFQSKWQTEAGEMPATNRLNGELHAGIGKADLFMGLYNLEDDRRESSTYTDGWMVLPVRSFRTGVEWHFMD